MRTRYCRLVTAFVFAFVTSSVARAQEAPPAAEPRGSGSPYEELTKSKDRTTQLVGERYLKLVRLQEWSSASGKSKISARYVAHDPDLQWVKLASVKGSGKTRVVKEIQVEVAKLSPSCQSRVKQIDLLQKKLDELIAKGPESGEGGQVGPEGYAERGAPMVDEQGVEPGVAASSSDLAPAESPASPAADAADTAPGADSDDPLGFAEVPQGPGPEAGGLPSFPGGSGFSIENLSAGGADRTQWRTSYPAFLANLKVISAEGGAPGVDWGELDELRQLNELIGTAGGPEYDSAKVEELSKRLGTVRWQLEFVQAAASPIAGIEVQFRVPQPPKPLEMQFVLDDPEMAPSWSRLPAGAPADVVGRLTIDQPNKITVRVRLAQPTDGPPAAPGESAPSADERGERR